MAEFWAKNKVWIRIVAVLLALILLITIVIPALSALAAERRARKTPEEYMTLAQTAASEEDYDTALALLEAGRAETEEEENVLRAELWLQTASVYALQGDAYWMAMALNTALEEDPSSAQALLLRAQLLLAAGETGEALTDLENYMALRPEDTETALSLAQLYESLGRYGDARSLYNTVAELLPTEENDAAVLNALRCAFLEGDYAGAETGFEAYLSTHPEAPADFRAMACYLQAACRMQLDDAAGAVEGFYAAIDEGYDEASCLEQVVLCAFDAGDYEAVIAAGVTMETIQGSPQEPGVFYQRLGLSYLQQERFEEAEGLFALAAEHDPSLEGSRYYRGVCLSSLERWEEAVEELSLSLEAGMLEQYCYYNRGVCHLQLGQYEEALADLRQAAEGDEDPALALEAQSLVTILEEPLATAPTSGNE